MNRQRKGGKTLKEEIIDYLRAQIITNELKPGDRVVELDIAKKYNISRGPVREAVRLLEDQGLLEYKKNIGCVVKVLSKKELNEIHLIMSSLEKLALNLTSGQLKDERIEKIEKLVEKLKGYEDLAEIEEIIETDYEIHKQIVLNTENDKLFQLWDSMKSNYYALYFTVLNKNYNILNRIYKKHLRLLNVLKEKDLEKSIEEITEHYESPYRLIS